MRYLKGYLKIRIKGYSPERFLNLCKNKKIDIWGLEATYDSYLMYMYVSDFRKIKSIVKKTKTKITIEERIGMPFFFYKYRKRFGFWIGAFCCTCLIVSFTFFVWDIECTGNQQITKETLLDFLEDKSIYPGALKNKISCEKLAKEIRNDFDEIIWVSVSMKGTKLMIQIKENSDTFTKDEVPFYACDLISKKNGVVMNIVTRSGISKVAQGSEIKKGDIIVAGVIEIYNDAKEVITTHRVIADADITLQTIENYTETISRKHKVKKYTGKSKKVHFIKMGNTVFSSYFSNKEDSNFEEHTKEYQIKIGKNLRLPCTIGVKTYKEYKMKEEKYSNTEMEQLLMEHFETYCEKLENTYIQITENDFHITQTEGNGTLNASLILLEENCFQRKNIDF